MVARQGEMSNVGVTNVGQTRQGNGNLFEGVKIQKELAQSFEIFHFRG
jgi:hypothetical protein